MDVHAHLLELAPEDAAGGGIELPVHDVGHQVEDMNVEAAIQQGWERFIGEDGAFVGMTGFGASGPYKELYKHFGITAEKVAEAALSRLGKR